MNEIERISPTQQALAQAKQALAKIESIPEAKEVSKKAEAVRQVAKRARTDMNIQNEWAEISLRAQRVWGKMLEGTELNKGVRMAGKDNIGGYLVEPPKDLPTLADLDTTKKESHRVQLIASLPNDMFEAYIAETLAPDELTTAGALRIAKKLQQVEVETPPLPEGKYNVIYADPPWRYDFSETDSRKIENQYPTMSLGARIGDTLILCSTFQVYFAPEKAGGGLKRFAYQTPPDATSTTFGYC